jgi:hypothetical protein
MEIVLAIALNNLDRTLISAGFGASGPNPQLMRDSIRIFYQFNMVTPLSSDGATNCGAVGNALTSGCFPPVPSRRHEGERRVANSSLFRVTS